MPLPIANQAKEKLLSLKKVLHQHTAPAAEELVERLPGGDVRCYACGHRCLVKPGRDGVCRVRFNEDGILKVPFGYVGPLACDPIEKKPFFHMLPGSDCLTFGMLGCDYHCGYCFAPGTVVLTDAGPMAFEELFAAAERVERRPDAEVAYPAGVRTVAGSGAWRKVEAVFRHRYAGKVAVVRPFYLPEVRCTPDHSFYATDDPAAPPKKVKASELTTEHYLAVPRRLEGAGGPSTIDVAALLADRVVTHHLRWDLSPADRQLVATATAEGRTSAQIGRLLGKDPSYVRHVRSKLARGSSDARTGGAVVEEGMLRFAHERRPGIPAAVALDEALANLLGYYCAEGCVVVAKGRPNSHVLNFSFSRDETQLAGEVIDLLRRTLGVHGRLVRRSTTLAVTVGKTSAALFFKALCGGKASAKRVPPQVLTAPEPVARAFLDAYVRGDGHRYPNGKVGVTTVSRDLAYGMAHLALRLGRLPSVYDSAMPEAGTIEGRAVRRSPHQYTVVWYEASAGSTASPDRRIVETDAFHLVPLRSVSFEDHDGDVYNMQVEAEHNYLANLALVANCQNWVTSQMLRDPDAVAQARLVTPQQLVQAAIQNGAPVIASSYNEPLITSEWAVEVFKAARPAGLRCAYISNGNATPQVLDFLRPHVDAYKVDLKTFDDKHYRELGGVLENVTETIRNLKARGFWVEIVTLVVPGFSDDLDDLKRMAEFLAGVDPLMPWHMTAFHPDYKMTDGYRRTTADDLMRVVEIGRAAGLKYLYPGNLPGMVGELENTRCHHCGATLIRRRGFLVTENRMAGGDGLCPDCRKPIPGIWGKPSGHGDGRVRAIL